MEMATSPPPIHRVPYDILEMIFSYCNDQDSKSLLDLSRVCKRWKTIAQKILFSRPYLTRIKNIAKFFNIISQDRCKHLRELINGISLDETFHLETSGKRKIGNVKKFMTDLNKLWDLVEHWLGVLADKHSLTTLAISGSLVSFIAGPIFKSIFKVDTLILTHPKGISTPKLAKLRARNLIIYGCFHAFSNTPCLWYNVAKIRDVQNFTFKIENTLHYKGFIMDLCKALNFRQLCSFPAIENLNIHVNPIHNKVPGFKDDLHKLFDKKLLVNVKNINVQDWYPCKPSTIQQERYEWKHNITEIAQTQTQTQNRQQQNTLDCYCILVKAGCLGGFKDSMDTGYYEFLKNIEENDMKFNLERSELEKLTKEDSTFRFAVVFSENDSFAKRVKKVIGDVGTITSAWIPDQSTIVDNGNMQINVYRPGGHQRQY